MFTLQTIPIPATHVDLLTRQIAGVLSTVDGDGQPRSTLVSVGFDGESPLIHATYVGKVCLLVVDPENTGRFIQIRGDVEATSGGPSRLLARRITLDAIHA